MLLNCNTVSTTVSQLNVKCQISTTKLILRSIYLRGVSDINECNSTTLNECDQVCVNTIGSYACTCDEGHDLQEDRRTCIGRVQ